MGLLRRLRDGAGRALTAAAALLVVGMMAVPALWPGLFGLTRAPAPLTLAGVLLGVSLLDRFRPTRWFLLWALPGSWILGPALAASGYRGMLIFQAVCATGAWMLLQSGPVRAYFRAGGGWLETFFRERALAADAGGGEVGDEADRPSSLPPEPSSPPRATWSPPAPAPPAGDAVAAGTREDRIRPAAAEPAHGWWSEP